MIDELRGIRNYDTSSLITKVQAFSKLADVLADVTPDRVSDSSAWNDGYGEHSRWRQHKQQYTVDRVQRAADGGHR